MADVKATAITNADATPKVKSSKDIFNGTLKESVGTVEVEAAIAVGTVCRFARVRSSDRISQVLLSCDSLGTTGAADVGIYNTAENGGAAVDADFFASAQALTAALVNQDVTHEADAADAGAGFGLADVEKPLWQALGLAKDPVKDYDIAATITTTTTAAGTISLKVRYV